MAKAAPRNLILTGFSGSGKSVVGREIARRLGWAFVDTDAEVAARAGKPIPDIFVQDGEPAFRELERQVLEWACAGSGQVIATGGGAVLSAESRALMAEAGVVLCLEAQPQTILRRLREQVEQAGSDVSRPLLVGEDPLARIQALKEFRQPFYAAADWAIHTDALAPAQVAREALRAFRLLSRHWPRPQGQGPLGPRASARESDAPYCEDAGATFVVEAPSGRYPVFVGWGILDGLGQRLRNAGLKGKAILISDEMVFARHGRQARESLERARFEVLTLTVPAGEASKSLEQASRLYDKLIAARAERGHAMVALGGGVVGDLAGFVAATYLRGVPLVQAPTSLLAMVDAGVGGKVAVNHKLGKNLIGAFYQPRLVLMDVATLATLPPRELASGWAEVIKHGLILDSRLFRYLERHAPRLAALDRERTVRAVGWSAAVKGKVVAQDERETKGLRTLLNYGHTIGHALEATSGYQDWLHGEAVAVGMMGAARLSQRLGLIPEEVVERQRALLMAFGLPTRCPGADISRLTETMALDKKVAEAKVRWVLLKRLGQAVVRGDVPPGLVREVLEELGRDGRRPASRA
ncbi:MAG: 3-dehydroquinate synthase [Chloroflexi bacterium]|nr:3-dehydroquinate synthase [Chloroflexota bacterium]